MKWLWLVLVVSMTALQYAPAVEAADANDFVVSNFSAEYHLSRDENNMAQLSVVETIVAEFPDFDQNYGIFRSIPYTYKNYDTHLQMTSIVNELGVPYLYETSKSGNQEVYKIGDPNKFVRGSTTYIISYTMDNVIEFSDDGQNFFWDINGNGWNQHIQYVEATVYLSQDIAPLLSINLDCYTGEFGSAGSDCTVYKDQRVDQTIVRANAQDLAPSETLSIKLHFNDQPFYRNPWTLFWLRIRQSMLVVLPLITSSVMFARWNKYGRDPRGRGVIIPRYSPPPDMDAILADVILNERLETKAISAAIIEMAVNGYIRLHETSKKKFIGTETEYEIELLRTDNGLSSSQLTIINALFGSHPKPGSRAKINDLSNKLYTTSQSIGKLVPNKLYAKGIFKYKPAKIRGRYIGVGVGFMVLGAVAMILGTFTFVGLGLAFSGVVIAVFANAMPARTEAGVRQREHLLGLEQYMKLAEAERIKYLQSPEGVKQYGDPTKKENQIHLFEQLLPYAMLFGMEKGWAAEFKDLYDKPPQWFNSPSGQFSAVYLANSLQSFNSASSAAFTPPSSSGSSGGSFAGGGGGGGGGGGW